MTWRARLPREASQGRLQSYSRSADQIGVDWLNDVVDGCTDALQLVDAWLGSGAMVMKATRPNHHKKIMYN